MENKTEKKLPDVIKVFAPDLKDLDKISILRATVVSDATKSDGSTRYLLATPFREAAGELLKEHQANTKLLNDIALQLDKWADESWFGGWSTHQVQPQHNLADKIRRQIANQLTVENISDKTPG